MRLPGTRAFNLRHEDKILNENPRFGAKASRYNPAHVSCLTYCDTATLHSNTTLCASVQLVSCPDPTCEEKV